ncbi:MAG: FMN-binding protein [Lachnospiraceae bacterium]|nr:FMN-binding protein [Lachnospiraceae bacterium]
MKKLIKIVVVLLVIVLIGVIGFSLWSTKLVKEAAALKDVSIDMSEVEDGVYEGHSELGPVIVDVKVIVENSKIIEVEILQHQNGLGQTANVIVEDMVDKNTYDVDAVSGATVSSEIIMNAVNDALQKGLK